MARFEAEVAFEVQNEHWQRGLAALLLERLACVARPGGILRFSAHPGSAQQPPLRGGGITL